MNNTKENTNVSNTENLEELAKSYIKHDNGAIFQVLPHEKDFTKVWLRYRNKYEKFEYKSIRQGLVDGRWREVNVHELRKHLEAEQEYFSELNEKLVKRVILTQVLMELDDDLKKDFVDDKYMRNVLDKSEKQFSRLVEGAYDRMYKIDKTMLQNFMNQIDSLTSKCAKVPLQEFYFLNEFIDLYLADPKKYHTDTVLLDKID